MKTFWLLAVAMATTSPATHARDARDDEREIRRVETALCRAFETGDVGVLRSGLDQHFTLTDSAGKVTDLEQNLAEVERRDPAYEEFRNHGQ
jgi:hypothetical protein